MNFMNISSYKNNGFVIVKNVIPKKNILDLRDKLMSEAPPNFVGHLENDYVTSTPELYKYQFDKQMFLISYIKH